MLRTLLDTRTFLAMAVALAVGVWGLRTYPLPPENVFLALIALRRPDLHQGLQYGYATVWFTTPFFGASLLGSALIGILATMLNPSKPLVMDPWLLATLITLAGLGASLFDSFLGATVQAMYYCPTDQKETEKHPLHTCGTKTIHTRGWAWLNNDLVNLACGMFGSLAALILTSMLR